MSVAPNFQMGGTRNINGINGEIKLFMGCNCRNCSMTYSFEQIEDNRFPVAFEISSKRIAKNQYLSIESVGKFPMSVYSRFGDTEERFYKRHRNDFY